MRVVAEAIIATGEINPAVQRSLGAAARMRAMEAAYDEYTATQEVLSAMPTPNFSAGPMRLPSIQDSNPSYIECRNKGV